MFADIKADLNSSKKELTYTNNEIIKTSQRLEQLTKKFQDFNSQLTANIKKLKDEILLKYNELQEYKHEKQDIKSELVEYDRVKEQCYDLNIKIKETEKEKAVISENIIKIEYAMKSIQNTISEVEKLKEGLCETCTKLFNSRYRTRKA